jgi:hypothetical protein
MKYNLRPVNSLRKGSLPIWPKVVPWPWSLGPHDRGRERPDGPVRARAESCTGPVGTARSAGIVMALRVAGFVAGGTKIDRAKAGGVLSGILSGDE